MDRTTKISASVIAGVVAAIVYFLFLTPSSCSDIGGVPSWERCTSWLEMPAFSVEDFGLNATLNVIPPVLVGILVGLITWWLLDLYRPEDIGGPEVSDLAEDQ